MFPFWLDLSLPSLLQMSVAIAAAAAWFLAALGGMSCGR